MQKPQFLCLSLYMAFMSAQAGAQVITTQDTTVVGAGAGAAAIYYSDRGVRSADAQINAIESEISGVAQELANDVERLNDEAVKLRQEAKLVESGKPNPNSRQLYEGKFIQAGEYNANAGNSAYMTRNSHRLQADGAQKIADAISQEAELAQGNVRVVLHRVHGSQDGRITMAQPSVLEGKVEDVAKKLVAAAQSQSATATPNSIVKVDLEWNTFEEPNPKAAARLVNKAEGIEEENKGKKVSMEEKAEKKTGQIKEKLALKKTDRLNQLKVMTRMRIGGGALIAGSIFLGTVRYSLAQSFITLSRSCLDQDALITQATSLAVQTESDVDQIAMELMSLCAR